MQAFSWSLYYSDRKYINEHVVKTIDIIKMISEFISCTIFCCSVVFMRGFHRRDNWYRNKFNFFVFGTQFSGSKILVFHSHISYLSSFIF